MEKIKLKITTKNNDPEELKVKSLLEIVLEKYSCPIFIDKVLIEKNAVSHSYPILTLGTTWFISGKRVPYLEMDQDFMFLSILETFIHEQFHWFSVSCYEKNPGGFDCLLKDYLPFGDEYRSNDDKYIHLIEMMVCWNTRNYLQKILTSSQIDIIYDHWRPYPKTEKFITKNFKKIFVDLEKFDMVYKGK
jgi:hypothetical protein